MRNSYGFYPSRPNGLETVKHLFDLSWGSVYLIVAVDYVSYEGRYESHVGRLCSLEVKAQTFSQYIFFFRKVAELMGCQEDAPACSQNLHINLSPVFRVKIMSRETGEPIDYMFLSFDEKYLKDVSSFRRK